jgi:hypothetical protein
MAQELHAEAPALVEYVSEVHVQQVASDGDIDPIGPYIPGKQCVPMHTVAPVDSEYDPEMQSVQADAPIKSEKDPTPQPVHSDAPANPLYVPTGHDVHEETLATQETSHAEQAEILFKML